MMKKGPYEIFELDASCLRIEENGVRSFLFIGQTKALLIDSGFGTGDLKAVVEELTALPMMLVSTHADGDHIGCNKLFEKAYMHPAEYDRYHCGAGAGLQAEPLWEGEQIDIGGRSFEVILIPGHTPGSIALLDAQNRILIAGDSIQAGTVYMFGPGRNMPAYIQSMKRLEAMAGRYDTIYPSHGPIPVMPGIIPALVAGAQRVLAGEVVGTPMPDRPGVHVYDVGEAKFLFD